MTQKDNTIYNNVTCLTANDIICSTTSGLFPQWSRSYPPVIHDNYYYIEKLKKQLPTILKIKKAKIVDNNLFIQYKCFFDKYLPNNGTLYLSKLNLYCIFGQADDEYWYNNLKLTYNLDELKVNHINELNNSFCILINDYDIKLDNQEIIKLSSPKEYKNYAHKLLENLLNSEPNKSKSEKLIYHNALEKELIDLYE